MRSHGPRLAPDQRRDGAARRELQDAGLVEVYTDEQGREAYRLTEDGVRVGHMLAMVEGPDADKVLAALLHEPSAEGRP